MFVTVHDKGTVLSTATVAPEAGALMELTVKSGEEMAIGTANTLFA